MKEAMMYILPVLFGSIIIEMLWSWRTKREAYNAKETASNFLIFAGMQLVKPLSAAWTLLALGWLYQFRLWTIPNTVWSIPLAVLVVDFFYYWRHRLSHEIPLLWTLHNVHHSSPWMNLTTSMRLNWLSGFLTPLFFFPVVLMGFSVEAIALFMLLNLFYQFFLHTESITKIPFVEGWINTPSAHRVHHGSNPLYIDKNHGGILMVWDRMFGTYQEETEEVVYGITTGFMGHNPLKAVFGPLWDYLRGDFAREKAVLEQRALPLPEGSKRVAAVNAIATAHEQGISTLAPKEAIETSEVTNTLRTNPNTSDSHASKNASTPTSTGSRPLSSPSRSFA